jgi:hypothetical protein
MIDLEMPARADIDSIGFGANRAGWLIKALSLYQNVAVVAIS